MRDNSVKSLPLFCNCHSLNHVCRLTLDKEDGFLLFEIMLNDYLPFYKKLWVAIKYILGYKSSSMNYDILIIKEEDVDNLIDMLKEKKKIDTKLMFDNLDKQKETSKFPFNLKKNVRTED